MNSNLDPHIQLEEWLVDGAANDPPREMAFHASMCDECLSRLNAFDSLSAVDVGAAGSPPPLLAPTRVVVGLAWARLATAAAGGILALILVLAGASQLIGFVGHASKPDASLVAVASATEVAQTDGGPIGTFGPSPATEPSPSQRSYPLADSDVHPAPLGGTPRRSDRDTQCPLRLRPERQSDDDHRSDGLRAATAAQSRSGRSGVPRAAVRGSSRVSLERASTAFRSPGCTCQHGLPLSTPRGEYERPEWLVEHGCPVDPAADANTDAGADRDARANGLAGTPSASHRRRLAMDMRCRACQRDYDDTAMAARVIDLACINFVD